MFYMSYYKELMIKKYCIKIMVAFPVALFLFACATAQKTAVREQGEARNIAHPTEVEAKSLGVFTEALDLIESSSDRRSVLPQVEDLYMKIIKEYHDAPLAQESYWRLISIYIDDYSPPAYEKAEPLYHEFLKDYPDSPLRGFIEETLGKSYYKNKDWDKLLQVCTPAFKEYTEERKRSKPSLMFMYAEANFNMGNVAEAEKSYRLFLDAFPKVSESVKAKKRLEEMRRP
jgi:tetratricopeptide (TPR) repeat protein